jgi:hypothetical protein
MITGSLGKFKRTLITMGVPTGRVAFVVLLEACQSSFMKS